MPVLVFLALGLFLVSLPFGLILPGAPSGLKADESAYYMMAMSLAFDGDVELQAKDTERLFDEFSLRRTRNLVISSNDNWDTVYYGKPHLYSLFAAPFARIAGYRGILAFNMLLFVGLIGMLWRYLATLQSSGLALLFACLFFLLGATWNYAFWIQPEILSMFGVGGALFFGLRRSWSSKTGADLSFESQSSSSAASARLTSLMMAATSGAMLAVAVYNKPYLAPIGMVFVAGAIHHWRTVDRQQALRWFGAWCGGAAVALGFAAVSAFALTGSPSSYVGVDRDSATVCEPGVMPQIPERVAQELQQQHLAATASTSDSATALPEPDAAEPAPRKKSWTWIFRIPPVPLMETVENLQYFFIGRHTGLLIYFPFVGAAMLSFFWMTLRLRRSGERDPLQWERWTLLATSLGIGVFLLLFISWNWQGGGGFIGNRYFVTAVPAFGFLAARIRPSLILIPALAAGVFLGPLLLSPFGLVMAEPTLQAHTRSSALSILPLELSLKNVPGYHTTRVAGMRLVSRADHFLSRGESFWTQGKGTTDVTVLVDEPLGGTAFLVTGVTDQPATVTLDFAGASATTTVEPKTSSKVTLTPTKHRRRHNPNYQLWNVYPLEVSSDQGTTLAWQRHMPPNSCPQFVRNDVYQESFFAGAQVAILGPAERLELDVYGVRWNNVTAPAQVNPGAEFEVSATVTNTSSADWPARGGTARVALSYHWLEAESAGVIEYNGKRTQLGEPIAAGHSRDVVLSVAAPAAPGNYVLQLDPVFEHVAWFQDRGAEAHSVPITVAPAAGTTP